MLDYPDQFTDRIVSPSKRSEFPEHRFDWERSFGRQVIEPGGRASIMQDSIPLIVGSIIFRAFWVVRLIFGIRETRQGKGRTPLVGDRFTPGLLMTRLLSPTIRGRNSLPRIPLPIGALSGWMRWREKKILFFFFSLQCPPLAPPCSSGGYCQV